MVGELITHLFGAMFSGLILSFWPFFALLALIIIISSRKKALRQAPKEALRASTIESIRSEQEQGGQESRQADKPQVIGSHRMRCRHCQEQGVLVIYSDGSKGFVCPDCGQYDLW